MIRHLLAAFVAAGAFAAIAEAQPYPSRPVHLIVSFAAGGPNDIVARIIGQLWFRWRRHVASSIR